MEHGFFKWMCQRSLSWIFIHIHHVVCIDGILVRRKNKKSRQLQSASFGAERAEASLDRLMSSLFALYGQRLRHRVVYIDFVPGETSRNHLERFLLLTRIYFDFIIFFSVRFSSEIFTILTRCWRAKAFLKSKFLYLGWGGGGMANIFSYRLMQYLWHFYCKRRKKSCLFSGLIWLLFCGIPIRLMCSSSFFFLYYSTRLKTSRRQLCRI